jgi:hypothetical protein
MSRITLSDAIELSAATPSARTTASEPIHVVLLDHESGGRRFARSRRATDRRIDQRRRSCRGSRSGPRSDLADTSGVHPSQVVEVRRE